MQKPKDWLTGVELSAGGGDVMRGRRIVAAALGIARSTYISARGQSLLPARWFVGIWRIASGGRGLRPQDMPPVEMFAFARPRDQQE